MRPSEKALRLNRRIGCPEVTTRIGANPLAEKWGEGLSTKTDLIVQMKQIKVRTMSKMKNPIPKMKIQKMSGHRHQESIIRMRVKIPKRTKVRRKQKKKMSFQRN